MVNRLRFTPVFCAALGTAIGFYLLSSLIPVVSIIFVLASLAVYSFFNVLSSLDRKENLFLLTTVCCVVFTSGLMIGICAANAGRSEVKFSLPQNKITAIEGVLSEDPRIISGGRAIASVSLKRCAGENGLRASSHGEITVFFPQSGAEKIRQFGRGTAVFSEGTLRSSETGWTFSANSIHVVKRASAIERMRTDIRLNLINRFDGKDWGGLALALLLGIKDNLDTNLAVLYRNAGCSYILALSGMHLAVLAALIALLLKKPLGLKASAITGAVIICLYCFIVGPMPSLNRAALMYLLGVIAILGALPKEPLSILSLSFLIQIIITPASGHSISFILSYLALFGILIIGQPLYSLFAGKAPDILLQPLSASCGAFLATAGVTGFSFGIIVPAGIITGLVLVPLTTVFMIGSMIWLALDFFSLSGILNQPLSLLYQLMEKIVSLAGGIGGISAVNPFVILVFSFVIAFLILGSENYLRKKRLTLQPFP
jgi:competence protein ComEC